MSLTSYRTAPPRDTGLVVCLLQRRDQKAAAPIFRAAAFEVVNGFLT